MPALLPEQYEVDAFLPPYKPLWTLDPENPGTASNIFTPQDYMRLREDLTQAMNRAREVLAEVATEYSNHFGLPHRGGLIEEYRCEDADVAVLALGALASEAKAAVDDLRKRGLKAGLARIRVFRPFPIDEIRRIAKSTKKMVILDRDISAGMEGILFTEVKAALFEMVEKPHLTGFIVGLGGVDVTSTQIAELVEKCSAGKVQHDTIWVRG